MTTTLAVRLDSDGDVLLTGPALRALAGRDGSVDLLTSPTGRQAAEVLPGVGRVLVFAAPWSGYRPPPLDVEALERLVARLRGYERAFVFVSAHQSPLPAALVLRTAGIGWIAADSEDYPGSLLNLRHHRRPGRHEVQAALDLVEAAGAHLPPGDDARLAVRRPLPDVSDLVPAAPYVVVHPGASVPARAPSPEHAAALVEALVQAGRTVVVTGSGREVRLGAAVAGAAATNLAGRTTYPRLAAVLAGADAVVVGNTGPAHLAAAVGTPLVSLFAPVVPAERWAPWGVPAAVLGDQDAACAGTRARSCPLPGHPCLSAVAPSEVIAAVDRLTRTGVAV